MLFGGVFIFLPLTISAQLLITEVYRDTPYSEYIDTNNEAYQNPTPQLYEILRKRHRGEFVEIFNASDTDLNLKDWMLRDDEGTYYLPNKIIKSGQFMVVAANNNVGGDYFPNFFSTTQGKENQIIYQNIFKLSNADESISLIARNVAGETNIAQEYVTSSISFQQGTNLGVSVGSESVNNPSVFYDVKDWQYGYQDSQIPNPLSATVTPPIKPIEDYIGPLLYQNYNIITWDSFAESLIDNSCKITINDVYQTSNISLSSGGKSFMYDSAGNASASTVIIPPGTPSFPTGYAVDIVEQIKNAIKVSPNPTYDVVNVHITGIAQGKVSSLQVFSSTGALLFTKNNLQDGANFIFSFNLVNQITGVYVANFTLNTGQVVSKNILKY